MNIELLSRMTHDIKPSKERRRQGVVERSPEQVQDTEGNIGDPWIARSLLWGMEQRGAISAEYRVAGERFHELFQLAALDPLHAADMGRVPTSGIAGGHRGSIGARDAVDAALRALGGTATPSGCCAWFVLGCEYSVRHWAAREGWRGRPISPDVARGILIATLGTLEQHFGT